MCCLKILIPTDYYNCRHRLRRLVVGAVHVTFIFLCTTLSVVEGM